MAMLKVFCITALFAAAALGQLITTDPDCADEQCNGDCRCASQEAPAGLTPAELPQLVLLSFDDAITWTLHNDFYSKGLFDDTLMNPNGCPIRATFFIVHDYTNYTLVHEYWKRGFEMASHSMTNRVPADYWAEISLADLAAEMTGLRTAANEFAKVDPASMVGVRAPFLQMNGNDYARMMTDNGFVWDASRPTLIQADPGLWPYTYDFTYRENAFLDCPIKPCIGEGGATFPGVWQVPINDLLTADGVECAMLDQCIPETYDDAMNLLRTNFAKHYGGTRSPFNLFTRPNFLTDGNVTHNFEALKDFLKEILQNNDVFVVPVGKAIEYMRNPETLEIIQLGASEVFRCDAYWPDQPPFECDERANCPYCDDPSHDAAADGRAPTEYIMPVCGRCPPCFPNPLDPTGKNCVGDPGLVYCDPTTEV